MKVREPLTVVRQVFAVLPADKCARHRIAEAVVQVMSQGWIIRGIDIRLRPDGNTSVTVERYLMKGEIPPIGSTFSVKAGVWKQFRNEDDLA